MKEGRFRLISLIGTIVVHLAVVLWLTSTPDQRAALLNRIEMDVVDLTPEPESEPEPDPEPEPEPPPPPPEPEIRPQPRVRQKQAPEPEATLEPQQAQEATPAPPRLIDFSDQNMVSPGSGTGFQMPTAQGGSSIGAYRPGQRGGNGDSRSRATEPSTGPTKRADFNPIAQEQRSRDPELIGQLDRRYPTEARRQFIEGQVRLLVEIRANGTVRNVRVIQDPGGGLGQAALAAVRAARFRPALDRNGNSVDCRIIYSVRYLLDD